MKLCFELPPAEIYDVLHLAEAHGVTIPKDLDDWWSRETVQQQEQLEREKLSDRID